MRIRKKIQTVLHAPGIRRDPAKSREDSLCQIEPKKEGHKEGPGSAGRIPYDKARLPRGKWEDGLRLRVFPKLRCLRIVSCYALPQSCPIFAYRGMYPTFMLILGPKLLKIMMPADCFVLRTLTILPNIRISRESSRFYAHIGAGHKVFRPLMSELKWS